MALVPYDDRDGLIWYDGVLRPWREVKLHVLTHGLHYASAVFEGERAYNGHVFKLREHSQRLVDSATIMDMRLPWTVEQIDEATRVTLAASGLTDAYVRPIAWRGSEMMGVSGQKNAIHLAIAVWSWGAYFGDDRMKGIRLDIGQWRRPDPQTAPTRAKAAGLYMIATLNKHAAEAKGYADALMLDWRGQVAEATGANIFFVIDGELHTPTPDCFLDGITRRTVMQLARNRQMKVVERAIRPEEMARATECFLTGTAAEVTPVAEIGPYRFTPGQITETLLKDYDRTVRLPPEEVARIAA
ncbi:branched-chain amino acid aminotransferase [Elioraea sp.]|uniref:branched-chain amino acid aminotransferase n=1 Tax=Elioraea sp. TaxID=2185103 RepID=UPI0021DC1481|nr:branched-chain amino acid aminotransferase [Elioraea sp.]GIX11283.1 MAG: branched-chain amino acid aminotransferase [Elioraea sp.]